MTDLDKLRAVVRKYTLLNAKQYGGQSNPKAIAGKVLADNPDYRKVVSEIMPVIVSVVSEVNKMSLEDIEKEIDSSGLKMADKPAKREGLKPLSSVPETGVVMRFEPSPSGPLHIGHAFPLTLNIEYVRMYGGKFILRISDTNPDNIDTSAYDMIIDDAKWFIGDDLSGAEFVVEIQSDRIEKYYGVALDLIKCGGAYVCTCDSDKFRELLNDKKPCSCRGLSVDENLSRWKRMLDSSGFKQGEAVLRVKTDIAHKNPSIRDWPAMRINETKHPRQGNKYRVWPLMNLSVAVDDMLMGMTHVIHGKDHMANSEKQRYLHKHLDYKSPVYIQTGRINFDGAAVSCSVTRPLILDGTYSGWDDSRIPFMQGYRKRGYAPAAFKKFYIEMGVSSVDKTVKYSEFMKTIDSYNKRFG